MSNGNDRSRQFHELLKIRQAAGKPGATAADKERAQAAETAYRERRLIHKPAPEPDPNTITKGAGFDPYAYSGSTDQYARAGDAVASLRDDYRRLARLNKELGGEANPDEMPPSSDGHADSVMGSLRERNRALLNENDWRKSNAAASGGEAA